MDETQISDLMSTLDGGLTVYPDFSHSDPSKLQALKTIIESAMSSALGNKLDKIANKDDNAGSKLDDLGDKLDEILELQKAEQKARQKKAFEDKKKKKEEEERKKSFEDEFEKIRKEFEKNFTSAQKLAFRIASEAINKISKFGFNLYKTQTEQIAKLSVSGITSNKSVVSELKNLVQETGMTRESLVSYLSSNSQVISKLGRFGGNALEKSKNAFFDSRLIPGITDAEVLSSTSLFLENITEFNNGFNIGSNNIKTASMETAKSLKMLSLATGKSVEQITQEIQAREKTILNRRLDTDTKTQYMYRALTSIGMNDDLIHYILTGKASETTARNMATPEGRNLLLKLRQIQLNSGGNKDIINAELEKLSKSNNFFRYQQLFKNVDPTFLAYSGDFMDGFYGLDVLRNYNPSEMSKKDKDRIYGHNSVAHGINKLLDQLMNPELTERVNSLTISLGNLFNGISDFLGSSDAGRITAASVGTIWNFGGGLGAEYLKYKMLNSIFGGKSENKNTKKTKSKNKSSKVDKVKKIKNAKSKPKLPKLKKVGKLSAGAIIGDVVDIYSSNIADYINEDRNSTTNKAVNYGLSVLGGAASGASTGAMIGSIFGPPGMAIGAGIGGIIGGTMSYFDTKNEVFGETQYKESNKRITETSSNNNQSNTIIKVSSDTMEEYMKRMCNSLDGILDVCKDSNTTPFIASTNYTPINY